MASGPETIEELHERASRPTEAVNEVLRRVSGDVIVLGAGGKMGFHLCAMIRRGLAQVGSKHKVIAVSRFGAPGSTNPFNELGIETIGIDLMAEGALNRIPDSNDIFFLAGVKFGTDASPDLLQQTNVELPRRTAERFAASRIVALSTGCVYPFANVESGGSIETDPMLAIGDYAESCIQRELAFSNSSAQVTLVRLNYSIDLRYGVLVDVARKVYEQSPVDVTTGYANVIWQGDANAYIVQSLALAANPPFVLNVTGSQTLRIRDIAQRFASLFGTSVEFVGQENPTAWLSNSEKCQKLFGSPNVDENELIQWVANWIMRGGESLNKPTHFEVRDGKY